MTAEETKPKNPRIIQASGVGSKTSRHYDEMELCDELSPGEAFAIQADDFDLQLLRALADDRSTGKKAFVVFEHEDFNCFEVRRLKDGQSPKRYYAEIEASSNNVGNTITGPETTSIERVKSVLREISIGTIESVRKYCEAYSPEMQAEGIVPYVALHRRLASVAMFRKDPRGPTVALRSAIDSLCEEGYLRTVPKGFGETAFGFAGELFKLEKGEK